MTTLKSILVILLGLFAVGCQENLVESIIPDVEIQNRGIKQQKVTGDVEIAWKGQPQSHENSQPGIEQSDPRVFVSMAAFEPTPGKTAKGHFTMQTLRDNEQHRLIEAEVFAAMISPTQSKAWFLALVTFDSKACGSHGGGSGGCDHDDEGGCEHDDGGGCEHDDGGGGCEHDDNGGGCEHDDGGGGCEHDDSGGDHPDGEHEGCSGSSGHEPGGGNVSGSRCRTGQIIAVKVHDVATPGADGDGLAWKWFAADNPQIPSIESPESWPHLCRKTILAGNLVVHY